MSVTVLLMAVGMAVLLLLLVCAMIARMPVAPRFVAGRMYTHVDILELPIATTVGGPDSAWPTASGNITSGEQKEMSTLVYTGNCCGTSRR